MLISAKLAPTVEWPVLEAFWRDADELGFHAIYDYDHFYGLGGDEAAWRSPTFEAWTTLAAMAALTTRVRVGCMVTGVTYRNPALLAKMAVTVDHLSRGRLEIGVGAAWHEPEHLGYGFEYPSAGTRIAMLDEALTLMKRLFTEDHVSHEGRFFTLRDAICEPKPVQRPHPPIVVGGNGREKTLRVVAKHADEWNAIGGEPADWAELSGLVTRYCEEIGRDPNAVRRGVQLFLHPGSPDQVAEQLDRLPKLEDAGCQHAVLSFYAPPTRDLLERCSPT